MNASRKGKVSILAVKEPEPAPKKDLNEWLLSPKEIAKRVATIREDLEAARDRYRGTMFDILTEGAEPRSLNTETEIREPWGLVNFLCPALEECYKRAIDGDTEDSLSNLEYVGTEVGFQIGMLAGLIFADCDPREIDRAECGLIHASAARKF